MNSKGGFAYNPKNNGKGMWQGNMSPVMSGNNGSMMNGGMTMNGGMNMMNANGKGGVNKGKMNNKDGKGGKGGGGKMTNNNQDAINNQM